MSTEKKDQCHCTQQVRPGDVDPYGIMHHSVYFQMYELAFFDYIKKRLGIKNKHPLIRQADLKYVKAATLGDVLEIETEIKEVHENDQVIVFRQKISKNGNILNRGMFWVELTGMDINEV